MRRLGAGERIAGGLIVRERMFARRPEWQRIERAAESAGRAGCAQSAGSAAAGITSVGQVQEDGSRIGDDGSHGGSLCAALPQAQRSLLVANID